MYQFIHIETYARKASTKKKPTNNKFAKAKNGGSESLSSAQRTTHNTPDSHGSGHDAPTKPRATVAGVIGEVMRDIGYCSHVDDPQAPTFLYGDVDTLRSIPARIEVNIEAFQKKHGTRNKLRADAHVLLAGTMSFPREVEAKDPARYADWKSRSLKFLKDKYGDDLQCVIEHQDEDHPHLHFYVMSAEHVNAKELHDGYIAASSCKAMTNEANEKYNDAMRDFQSAYYDEVGHACGLLRDGPRRKRLPTGVWHALKRSETERYEKDRRSEASYDRKLNELRLVREANADFMRGEREDVKAEREANIKALEGERKALDVGRVALEKEKQKVNDLLRKSEHLYDVLTKPELAGMVEFLDRNAIPRKVIMLAANNPEIFHAIAEQVQQFQDIGVTVRDAYQEDYTQGRQPREDRHHQRDSYGDDLEMR
jgi:hypothetical protein